MVKRISEYDAKKEIRMLKRRVNVLEEENRQMREELGEIKNKLGDNQPSKKIKVSKEVENRSGNTQIQPASEEVSKLVSMCKEQGTMDADDVQNALEDMDSPRSRPTALRIMKRMGDELPAINCAPPRKKRRRGYIISYNG